MPVFNLSKLEAAAANPQLTIDAVPVYEFGPGETAFISELTADEKEARIEVPWNDHKKKTGQENDVGFRAHVVAACWCNTQQRDFVAKSAEEIRKVAEMLGGQGKAVSRMFAMADKLNAVGDREIEDIEKNSPGTTAGNTILRGTSDSSSPDSSSAK
jgi:hypothetical protein